MLTGSRDFEGERIMQAFPFLAVMIDSSLALAFVDLGCEREP